MLCIYADASIPGHPPSGDPTLLLVLQIREKILCRLKDSFRHNCICVKTFANILDSKCGSPPLPKCHGCATKTSQCKLDCKLGFEMLGNLKLQL